MKFNRINTTLCTLLAALCLSSPPLPAQEDGDGGGSAPARIAQRKLDRIRKALDIASDTDWGAIEPLVIKVLVARRDLGGDAVANLNGGLVAALIKLDNKQNGGGQGVRSAVVLSPDAGAEAQILQKDIDEAAPAGQIKAALAKYRAARKAKEAALAAAQDELLQVLTTKQEAEADLLGLVH